MIIMHSYTFRDYPVERALAKAKEYGYDALELSPCHWGWSHAEMQANLDQTFATAERIGVPIRCVDYGGAFTSPDTAARMAAVENLRGLLRRLAPLGVTTVNGGCGSLVGPNPSDWSNNGAAIATEEQWQLAADSFRRVAEVAEATGVLVTFEIHMNTIHDTAAGAARLIDSVGSGKVRAALDAGNMLPINRAEKAPDAVRLLGDRLGYVHLKNCRLRGSEADYHVALHDGHIDYFAVMQAIREIGFAGDYCIEYCGLGDASPMAAGDIRYLRSLLTEAGLQ